MKPLLLFLIILLPLGSLQAETQGPRSSTSPSSTTATKAKMRSETSRSPNANPNRPRATAKRLRAIPRNWLQSTTALGIRYALFAGSAWLLGYVLFKNRWLHRKVIPAFPASKNVRREMLYSVRTVIIFGLVGALTLFAVRQGWTQMYKNISDYGNLWFALSIILGILLHDAYFYWTHRLMHHRRLFKIFHRGHHLSTNPIPWAAYAFDPLEALVHAMIFPIIAFAFPIHPVAFGLIMLWQITFNVVGHTGYEFHPRWLMDSWLGKFMNTPTNHAMHHETMRGNFGLYFNLWDRLMGTNHQDYETRFREVTQRKPSPLSYSPLALPLNSDPAIEAKSDATTT